MARAIKLHPDDNVATLIDKGQPGDALELAGGDQANAVLREEVPYGHKCAIVAVASGDPIIKYGQVIGRATKAIAIGCHAHVHNIEALRGRGDLEGKSS